MDQAQHAGNLGPGEAVTALAATIAGDACFGDALLHFSDALLALYTRDRAALRAIVEDRRWAVAVLVLQIHLAAETGNGPPPTRALLGRIERLRAFTGRDGLNGIIDVLCATGLLAEDAVAGDRRARRLLPQASLVKLKLTSLQVRSDVVRRLQPLPQSAQVPSLALLRDYLAARMAHFLSSSPPDATFPELRPFTGAAGGFLLLLTLLGMAERAGDDRVLYLNASHVAERLHVTRPHVVKILRNAAEQRILVQRDGGCLFIPERRQRLRGWIAMEIAIDKLALCAAAPA